MFDSIDTYKKRRTELSTLTTELDALQKELTKRYWDFYNVDSDTTDPEPLRVTLESLQVKKEDILKNMEKCSRQLESCKASLLKTLLEQESAKLDKLRSQVALQEQTYEAAWRDYNKNYPARDEGKYEKVLFCRRKIADLRDAVDRQGRIVIALNNEYIPNALLEAC